MLTPLRTPRLVIRPLRAYDLHAFLAYRNDPQVAIYQSWEPNLSEEGARDFIERASRDRPGVPGHGYQFAVALQDTDELIGDLYMGVKDDDPRQAEVGFTFGRQYQGQGYAAEAVRALFDYAFNTLGLHRVTGLCDTRNARSAALMERVGMRREAHYIKNFWFKDDYTDEYLYAILREEWVSGTEC